MTDVRGVVVVGDGPYDLIPILGAPAVAHAVRMVRELVGNVTLSGRPGPRAEAERLCAGLLGPDAARAAIVLLHEACRPLARPGLGSAVLDAVRAGAVAAVPVLPLTDTVKQVGPDGTLRAAADRATLRVVQAPVAFRPAALPAAPRDPLDLVRLCAAAGVAVHAVPGHPAATALRTAADLALVAAG